MVKAKVGWLTHGFFQSSLDDVDREIASTIAFPVHGGIEPPGTIALDPELKGI